MIFKDPETGVYFDLLELPKAKLIENGGYLIGSMANNFEYFTITSFTQAEGNDIQSETELILENEHHQKIISEQWRDSGGTKFMIGHWHTHFQDDPTPSEIDLETWRQMAQKNYNESGGSPTLCVIVGLKNTRAWVSFPEQFNAMIRELERPVCLNLFE